MYVLAGKIHDAPLTGLKIYEEALVCGLDRCFVLG